MKWSAGGVRACASFACPHTPHKTPYMDELTRIHKLFHFSVVRFATKRHHHLNHCCCWFVVNIQSHQNEFSKETKWKGKNGRKNSHLCTAGELICATTNNTHLCTSNNNNSIFIINYMIRCNKRSRTRCVHFISFGARRQRRRNDLHECAAQRIQVSQLLWISIFFQLFVRCRVDGTYRRAQAQAQGVKR